MTISRRLILAFALWPVAVSAADAPTVVEAWSRATGSGGSGALYMTLKGASRPDRLLKVETDVSSSAELHESTRDQGIVRMRPVSSIDVPADTTVHLSPGGYHVMLMGLTHPLVKGDHIAVTLTFETAGDVHAVATVGAAGVPSGMRMGPMQMDK